MAALSGRNRRSALLALRGPPGSGHFSGSPSPTEERGYCVPHLTGPWVYLFCEMPWVYSTRKVECVPARAAAAPNTPK